MKSESKGTLVKARSSEPPPCTVRPAATARCGPTLRHGSDKPSDDFSALERRERWNRAVSAGGQVLRNAPLRCNAGSKGKIWSGTPTEEHMAQTSFCAQSHCKIFY